MSYKRLWKHWRASLRQVGEVEASLFEERRLQCEMATSVERYSDP